MSLIISPYRFAPGGDLWTPANLPVQPHVWLNDTSGYVQVSGVLSEVLNDKGSLSSAKYTQATGAARPTRVAGALNGRAVIDWDGAQIMASTDSNVLGLFRNVSTAVLGGVYKLESAASGPRALIRWTRGDSTTSARVALEASNPSVGASANVPIVGGRRLDADAFAYASPPSALVDQWLMAVGVFDFSARTIKFYINGALEDTESGAWSGGGSTSNTASQRATIGAAAAGNGHLVGQTAELFATTAVPSTDDLDRLFGYWAHRYGLTSVLDGSHPYKSTPPLAPPPGVESMWVGAVS